MSSENGPLTTDQVEDGFAQNEWDVNAQKEESPRRERFRRWHAAELRKAKDEAWEEGHSWGWSDAQEAHDVRQDMTREDWSLKTPNPYRADQIEEDQP